MTFQLSDATRVQENGWGDGEILQTRGTAWVKKSTKKKKCGTKETHMRIVTTVRVESRRQGHASPGSGNHKDQPSISSFDLLDKHSGQEFYPCCFYIRETNMLLPGPKSSLVSWLISDLKIQFSCVSLWFYFPASVLDTLSRVVRMKRGAKRQVHVSLGLGTKTSKYLLPIQISRRLVLTAR